ncbi:MAG: response regulator [Spirochaetaceae bacterium]|jgi:CheY-like chemotaxis protein|nr:response regulator [Spirochaetaceae bacterium]
MKTIVHVDNSGFFRKLVKTFLFRYGFEVESFNLAKEALGVISGGQVGLILTGLSLPDMEGEEFISRVMDFPYTIPIIAFTSNQTNKTDDELIDLGIKGWVLKTGAWQRHLLPLVQKHYIAN